MVKKIISSSLFLFVVTVATQAQKNEDEEERGFKKENLFTGGSLTVSFFNGQTVLGALPHFGYKIADWLDAGISLNYQYAGARDIYQFDDKVRQNTFGPGAFARIYPVSIIFLQGQFEHNFVNAKYTNPGGQVENNKYDVSSFLIGGGLANGRQKGATTFYYISLLVDVMKDINSPYTRVSFNPDNPSQTRVEMTPIIRAGINIGLFQGKNRRR
jgi:hypothetical protein